MALSSFIKRLVQTDTIFGSEAKKLSGINDGSVRVSDTSLHFIEPATIRMTNTVEIPSWFVPGKYFRTNLTAYEAPPPPEPPTPPVIPSTTTDNHYKLFRIQSASIVSGRVEIVVDSSADVDSIVNQIRVTGTIDGRISTLINDGRIARPAENGSTIFNVDIQESTDIDDGSGVSLKFASHYHTQANPVFHEFNEFGNTNMLTTTVTEHHPAPIEPTDIVISYDLGPLPLVDENGDQVASEG